MQISLFLTALMAAGPAAAWPGMKPGGGHGHGHLHARGGHHSHQDIIRDVKRHAAAEASVQGPSLPTTESKARQPVLLGDLAYLRDEELTEAGRVAKRILLGEMSGVYRREEGSVQKRHLNKACKAKSASHNHTASATSGLYGNSSVPTSGVSVSLSTGVAGSVSVSSVVVSVSASSPAGVSASMSVSESVSTSASESASLVSVASAGVSVSGSSPASLSASESASVSTSLSASTSASAPAVTSASSSASSASSVSTSSSTSASASASATVASCSVWAQVADDISPTFNNGSYGCSALARAAIRLGFHDAGAWNTSVAWGGADGSIALSDSELARSDNDGLSPIVAQMKTWYAKWHSVNAGVGMADLIQLSAILATVACPLGPPVRFYVGREDDSRAAPKGLLPSAFDDAASLVALFEAKTLSADDLVALVGAHSTSQQLYTDAATAGEYQDSTPGVWDVAFYTETKTAPSGIYRFPSDIALSQYSETAATWSSFEGQSGQGHWNAAYADAYFRLSLLGVKNVNSMVDCSEEVGLGNVGGGRGSGSNGGHFGRA